MNRDQPEHGPRLPPLEAEDMASDPIREFRAWLARAESLPLREPLAMTLATAGADGRVSARVVLLKKVDARGFVFYTNYESLKAEHLAANPQASLVFYWDEILRQVRVEGEVSRLDCSESDAYFLQRPRGSQLGAWVSPQSQVLANREQLDREMDRLEQEYEGREIPRPEHWGGYRLRPTMIEFWQGRDSRLNDRIRYRRGENDAWIIERLAP